MLQGIPTASYGVPPASALCHFIEFGASYKAPPEETGKGLASKSSAKKKGRIVVITTDYMQKRRNDVKARTTLLLALPDEHQLRFSKYETAQELWEGILKTFSGNEATKMTKKNQLKQQYGNFKVEGLETLEQTFNRLQAIVSHLEFMDVEIEQDDLNQKFLTSLAPKWLIYTIVWRNRDDLDTISLDDVYNHLKVYEPEVLTNQKWNVSIATKWDILLESAEHLEVKTEVREKATNKVLRSYIANEEENHDLVADDEAPTEFALMVKSSSSLENKGNSQNNIDDKGYWDSGCSRHMTDNILIFLSMSLMMDDMCYLDKKEERLLASVDEHMLWHRRLGHLNFKTMNNLVRNNLVKGLPSKCFENDHTCVACLKRKQHKASCKTKLVNSVSKPLHTMHMDLFGPTSISSLNHKWYCLVVTYDFSRCDNEGEFKNKEMNEFYTKKGIRREFSNARTPQQNRVAKRRNRTLIEAARTMLADAKLPVTFWAKVVNTACYVQNRVLVNKSQNKPFGKFNAKGDEGYFVGYSMSSKAFRVFNKRTKKVEENLHVDFLENKLIEKGAGLNLLFDTDTLTNSMKYVPVVVTGTSSTNILALMDTRNCDALDGCNVDVLENSGIFNPTASSKVPSADQVEPAVSITVESEIPTVSSPVPTVSLDNSPESSSGPRLITKGDFSQKETPSLGNALTLSDRFKDTIRVKVDLTNMKTSIPEEPMKIFDALKDPSWVEAMQKEILQFKIQNVWILVDCPKGIRPIGTKWVLKNKKDKRGILIRNKARLVTQGLFLAYASFMGFVVYQMDVKSAFLYGTIDEEIYMMLPPGFQDPEFPNRVYKVEKAMYGLHQAPRAWYGTLSKYLLDNGFQRGTINQILFIRKHKGEFLLIQVYVDNIIFGSSNLQLRREFKALVHDKFQMSAMGELTFFLGLQGKDRPSKDVELHLYRSMIGSLMYLTASKPDIMFAVCTCARYQVTPKECHLHAVKRIFRYLKGHPKLGLWYPKESPFDLVAYSDNDYGGATQDRKQPLKGVSFWGEEHNIDFHPIVDFLEASHIRCALTISPSVYVSHIRQFWSTARIKTTNQETKILANVDGKPRTISESSLRMHLKLSDEDGISSLPDTVLFENLSLMGYNILPNQRFTFQKGQFSHQ
nr:hypothetical protein [Tanacetum cinerariifolium]